MKTDKIIFTGCTVRNFENAFEFLNELGDVILETCNKYEVKNLDVKLLKNSDKEVIQVIGVFQGSYVPEE